MGPGSDVVEISSDEEDLGFVNESFDWISGLLDDGRVEGLDDLMVVDEFSSPPVVQKKNSDQMRQETDDGKNSSHDGDDDCQILDSDPLNPVSIVTQNRDGGDGSDELEIVGEKGQLACRDFPHSRHLCANFPFSTTAHDKHCKMCHCYVCDSPAPCAYWGNGTLGTHHCHSNDKDVKWKALRQSVKNKDLSASQPQKVQSSMDTARPTMQDQAVLSHSNFISQHPGSNIIRPCSAISTPDRNVTCQSQFNRPPIIPYRGHRVAQVPWRNQLMNPRMKSFPRARSLTEAYTAPSVYSRARFKTVGTGQPVLTMSSPRGSQPTLHGSRSTQIALQGLQGPLTLDGVFSDNIQSTPHRSPSAPAVCQRQQNQQVTSVHVGIDRTCIPHFRLESTLTTPLVPQSQQQTSADLGSQSLEDILASVAYELGVPDYATAVQHSPSDSLWPPGYTNLAGQPHAIQETGLYSHLALGMKNSDPSEIECSLLNDTAAQSIQIHEQDDNLLRSADSRSDSQILGNDSISGQAHHNSLLTSLEEDVFTTAAQDASSLGFDPSSLINDLDEFGDVRHPKNV